MSLASEASERREMPEMRRTDDERSRFVHVIGAFEPNVLRALRAHLDARAASDAAHATTDRERRALARGESSDALRLDTRWMDAFRAPSAALLAAIGEHRRVAYPPQVRVVRALEHRVPWHQDVGYQRLLGPRGHRRHVTCFVPLDEDPATRPTLEFLEAPGLPPGELAHAPRDGFGAGLERLPYGRRVSFALALGDALVFGDLVPHRTLVPAGATLERRSLEFRLVRPADAVLDKDYFDVDREAFVRGADAPAGALQGVA